MRSGAITPTPTPAAGTVSRETLYKWMSDAGLWLSRKQRRTSYQLRSRREAFGELLQKAVHGRRLFEHDSIATVDLCESGQICVVRTSVRRKSAAITIRCANRGQLAH
ncbi:hypothetical protein IE4872_PC00414 (plasmid) [Rhizobium gallicum]|uniref:Uncharacterized protein n=1 Tax=Rhizobium gallicum TaxID=56730 RepID=A0A1L5NR97_9HYPH|nr:hypothetical protein IE4872_PC00414 [Rhizobium gallicum]